MGIRASSGGQFSGGSGGSGLGLTADEILEILDDRVVHGINGTNGTNGAPGIDGVDGAAGATGAAGAAGATGAAGAAGLRGYPGIDGAAAFRGLPGINGVDGQRGFPGQQGLQGITGATGFPGSNGANGATGLPGANGATGAQGIPGTEGAYKATARINYDASGNLSGVSVLGGGISALITDASASIATVTFIFNGSATAPMGIQVYGYQATTNVYLTRALASDFPTRSVAAGGTSGSPTAFTGFSPSVNPMTLGLTKTITGALAGLGQPTHCIVQFLLSSV